MDWSNTEGECRSREKMGPKQLCPASDQSIDGSPNSASVGTRQPWSASNEAKRLPDLSASRPCGDEHLSIEVANFIGFHDRVTSIEKFTDTKDSCECRFLKNLAAQSGIPRGEDLAECVSPRRAQGLVSIKSTSLLHAGPAHSTTCAGEADMSIENSVIHEGHAGLDDGNFRDISFKDDNCIADKTKYQIEAEFCHHYGDAEWEIDHSKIAGSAGLAMGKTPQREATLVRYESNAKLGAVCRGAASTPRTSPHWMYQNERGGLSGPYSLVQLSEGMYSGFLPEDLPILHVDGNDKPIVLKVLVEKDLDVVNHFVNAELASHSIFHPRVSLGLVRGWEGNGDHQYSDSGISQYSTATSPQSMNLPMPNSLPLPGSEGGYSPRPFCLKDGSFSPGLCAFGSHTPSDQSSLLSYTGDSACLSQGYSAHLSATCVNNNLSGPPGYSGRPPVEGVLATGEPVKHMRWEPRRGHLADPGTPPVHHTWLQSVGIPSQPTHKLSSGAHFVKHFEIVDQVLRERRWKYQGLNGCMEGPFDLAELSHWFQLGFLYGSLQIYDMHDCRGPIALDNLLSNRQNGPFVGLENSVAQMAEGISGTDGQACVQPLVGNRRRGSFENSAVFFHAERTGVDIVTGKNPSTQRETAKCLEVQPEEGSGGLLADTLKAPGIGVCDKRRDCGHNFEDENVDTFIHAEKPITSPQAVQDTSLEWSSNTQESRDPGVPPLGPPGFDSLRNPSSMASRLENCSGPYVSPFWQLQPVSPRKALSGLGVSSIPSKTNPRLVAAPDKTAVLTSGVALPSGSGVERSKVQLCPDQSQYETPRGSGVLPNGPSKCTVLPSSLKPEEYPRSSASRLSAVTPMNLSKNTLLSLGLKTEALVSSSAKPPLPEAHCNEGGSLSGIRKFRRLKKVKSEKSVSVPIESDALDPKTNATHSPFDKWAGSTVRSSMHTSLPPGQVGVKKGKLLKRPLVQESPSDFQTRVYCNPSLEGAYKRLDLKLKFENQGGPSNLNDTAGNHRFIGKAYVKNKKRSIQKHSASEEAPPSSGKAVGDSGSELKQTFTGNLHLLQKDSVSRRRPRLDEQMFDGHCELQPARKLSSVKRHVSKYVNDEPMEYKQNMKVSECTAVLKSKSGENPARIASMQCEDRRFERFRMLKEAKAFATSKHHRDSPCVDIPVVDNSIQCQVLRSGSSSELERITKATSTNLRLGAQNDDKLAWDDAVQMRVLKSERKLMMQAKKASDSYHSSDVQYVAYPDNRSYAESQLAKFKPRKERHTKKGASPKHSMGVQDMEWIPTPVHKVEKALTHGCNSLDENTASVKTGREQNSLDVPHQVKVHQIKHARVSSNKRGKVGIVHRSSRQPDGGDTADSPVTGLDRSGSLPDTAGPISQENVPTKISDEKNGVVTVHKTFNSLLVETGGLEQPLSEMSSQDSVPSLPHKQDISVYLELRISPLRVENSHMTRVDPGVKNLALASASKQTSVCPESTGCARVSVEGWAWRKWARKMRLEGENCGCSVTGSHKENRELLSTLNRHIPAQPWDSFTAQKHTPATVFSSSGQYSLTKGPFSSPHSARTNRAALRKLSLAVEGTDVLKLSQLKARKKRLKFQRSNIHEWGLIALDRIDAEDFIIEYIGELIRPKISDIREQQYESMGIGSSYLFRIDDEFVVDATRRGGLARFINHSCDPNCYTKIITIEGLKRVVIYSKRLIQAGEELTYDYKFPLEEKKISCFCGSARCRGFMN